jgi:hypothetical protein
MSHHDWLTDRQSQCDFDFKLVESPEGFSSWEYKDENGEWIVKIE